MAQQTQRPTEVTLNDTLKEAQKTYDYVRLVFADIHGIPRCRIVPCHSLSRMFEDGIGVIQGCLFLGAGGEVHIDKEELPTLTDPKCGNVTLIPQAGTLSPITWAKTGIRKVGQLIGEFQWIDTTLPFPGCPRYIARQQIAGLKELGFTLFSGFEVEYMLMDSVKKQPVFNTVGDYAQSDNWNDFEELILSFDAALQDMKVNIESHQIEAGKGQFESATVPARGIKSADDVFLLKQAVREMTKQQEGNLEAIFMSKPDPKDFPNALEFCMSLLDSDGRNVLHDEGDKEKLSQVAKYWLGGLIKHAGALIALTSPTVNCYRRLHQPWAPQKANWGIDNRQTAFRVKNHSKRNTLIEVRLPGGSANPYIVVAAILAAGIDGVVNKLPCPRQDDPDAVILPECLSEALDLLESNKVIAEALGHEFIKFFCLLKREFEIAVLEDFDKNSSVKEKEWELYKKL